MSTFTTTRILNTQKNRQEYAGRLNTSQVVDPTGLAPASLDVKARLLTAYITGPWVHLWYSIQQTEPLRKGSVVTSSVVLPTVYG